MDLDLEMRSLLSVGGTLRNDFCVPGGLYINGKFMPAASANCYPVINPATGEVLRYVADASASDALSAVDAASSALAEWARRSPRERGEVLRRAFDLIMVNHESLAQLITLENGKALPDSRSEVAYAAEFFRWYSEEGIRNIGEIMRAPSGNARILVQHKPIGVAVLVTPWNYPAAMATRKIGPALAAGCAVVVKPAPETPLTMLALMPLLEKAGVPPGLVNVLPTQDAAPVVDALLHDSRVRLVSFTGSTEVGRILLRSAADNVLNSAMELGGNAPFIVCADADIDASIDGAMAAKMRNLGEACTAANRFYVHTSVHDAFAEKFASRMSALKVGNGLVDGVDVGSLVNEKTLSKVARLVEDAKSKGAVVLAGGKPLPGPGYFYPPTVMMNVPDTADCLHEEIFGPVAMIQRFDNEDEVIARANSTIHGLVAYIYTSDLKRGLQMSEWLEFGMIGLNRGIISDPAAPFGGSKQSGIGREGGHSGLMEFLDTQYISLDW